MSKHVTPHIPICRRVLLPVRRLQVPSSPSFPVLLPAALAMISDNQLYFITVFLGGAAMLLILVYHYLELSAEDSTPSKEKVRARGDGSKLHS